MAWSSNLEPCALCAVAAWGAMQMAAGCPAYCAGPGGLCVAVVASSVQTAWRRPPSRPAHHVESGAGLPAECPSVGMGRWLADPEEAGLALVACRSEICASSGALGLHLAPPKGAPGLQPVGPAFECARLPGPSLRNFCSSKSPTSCCCFAGPVLWLPEGTGGDWQACRTAALAACPQAAAA